MTVKDDTSGDAAAVEAAEAKAAEEEAAAKAAEEAAPVDHAADAAKWKAMSRKHEAQAKSNSEAAKRLAEIEDANKSEQQKASDAAAAAEKRAVDAEGRALRFEVASEKNVPQKLMKFLAGGTREEIEASADELLEAIKPDTGDSSGGKPKEKLRPGADNSADADDDEDPRVIAARIPRSSF